MMYEYDIRCFNPEIYLTDNYAVLDFETTNHEHGSALDARNSLILSCWRVGKDHADYWRSRNYSEWADEYGQSLLCAACASADFVVAHHAKFELAWLKRCGVDLRKVLTFDTMISEKVIAGNRKLPLSLEATATRRRLGHKSSTVSLLIKAGVCPSQIPARLLEDYCVQDVALTERVFLEQRKELASLGLLPVAYCRNLVTPVLADIEEHGMGLDPVRVEVTYTDYKGRYDALMQEFTRLTGGINPKSPKQMREFLYEKMGFPEVLDYKGNEIKTDTGEKATSKDILTQLAATTDEQKAFKKVAIGVAKLKTPMQNILKMKGKAEKGERMYGTFNQCVAQTHRLSSSARLGGMQLQNPEKAFKSCFVARPGYVIIQADAAQIEFRVAADLGRDTAADIFLRTGGDVHALAATVLGISRDHAKSKTFRPLYGGSSGTPKEKKYYKAFRDAYPQIYKMQEGWTYEVAKEKKLRIASGLIFYWPDTEIKRSGYITNTTNIFNYPIQSFSWDVMSLVLRDVWERIDGTDGHIINTQHDSIILEINENSIDKVVELIVESFTNRIYVLLKCLYNYEFEIPFGVGVKYAEHWGEGKEIKHEAQRKDK